MAEGAGRSLGYDGDDDVRRERGESWSADPVRALQIELANERAQARLDREEQGYSPHPDQPRLTRDELRTMGRQIQQERLTRFTLEREMRAIDRAEDVLRTRDRVMGPPGPEPEQLPEGGYGYPAREVQGYLPHPVQPRMTPGEVRALTQAWVQTLEQRRTEMHQEQKEPRVHLRQRETGYTY